MFQMTDSGDTGRVRVGTSPSTLDKNPLVVASCGAGVQSTTILLLAIAGKLPKPDVAIFADTGWEPKAVYDQVARLERLSIEAGIAFHRVSNGNLRRDAIDPVHRYASIPYYVLAPEGETRDPIYASDVDTLFDAVEGSGSAEPRIVGWGSPRPLTLAERQGMGRRQCTAEYKLVPIKRKIRELLGARPPAFRSVPKGRVAEQWIGFSTDEVIRANRRKDSQGVSYLTTRYPLLELGMSRRDCERYLAEQGWGDTAKSACIGCPFHGNRQWRELRDHHPEEWADAVAFDEAIRHGGARGLPLRGAAFLHRSRLPLALAPIDPPAAPAGQPSLMEAMVEEGEPFGCSPFGCRMDAS